MEVALLFEKTTKTVLYLHRFVYTEKEIIISIMITDFPEVKKEILKALRTMIKESINQNAPVLSKVNKIPFHEGDKMGIIYEDGNHILTNMKKSHSEFTIARKDIPSMNANDFIEKVSDAAKDMADQIEKNILQTINKTTKESGNIIHGNPELSLDSLLIALEMIPVYFEDDDRTKPIKPFIFASPDAIEKFREREAKTTPEEQEVFRQKEEIILDKKYEEHIKDLEIRKIID